MEMEKMIKEISSNVLKVSIHEVLIMERLMGGMSNYTFVIEVKGVKYTFRIPGKKAEVFVDRELEIEHITLVNDLHINNETVYLDVETGVKIAKYVEGKPLHELNPLDYLNEVSAVLHKVHGSEQLASDDYAPYERLVKYEDLCKEMGYLHCERYHLLKKDFLSYKPFLDTITKVFCHGDSQVSNFIVGDKVYLTDWEFGGNNDPMYDIACFGNVDFTCAIELLKTYTNNSFSKEEEKRLYLWRSFQCLQWHNVAMYKELIGLSKDLHVDFAKISEVYLDKANYFLNEAKNIG